MIALAAHFGLAALADLALSTPPVLPWEAALIAGLQGAAFWTVGAAAAATAWLTSRLANPPAKAWSQGEPDRRNRADRRRTPRAAADRRAAVREAGREAPAARVFR